MLFGLLPEQFDILGAIAFFGIVLFGILGLKHKTLPRWAYVLLILIGVTGLIIDLLIVYKLVV